MWAREELTDCETLYSELPTTAAADRICALRRMILVLEDGLAELTSEVAAQPSTPSPT